MAASAAVGLPTKRLRGEKRVGHSGLEPEANGLRIQRRMCSKEARGGGGNAWSWSRHGRGHRGGHHGDAARVAAVQLEHGAGRPHAGRHGHGGSPS
jgi:hypothetical protein